MIRGSAGVGMIVDVLFRREDDERWVLENATPEELAAIARELAERRHG